MNESSKKLTLKAEIRSTKGKQNKSLRKSGYIPAVIFGEAAPSTSIKLRYPDFDKVFKEAGETTVVYLDLDGNETPTLVSNVSIHPVFEKYDHVDFRRVNLKKKIEAQVPVEVTGESLAVKQLGGVLLQQVQEVTVEALPQDIPHSIVVDISSIKEVGQEIKIGDLTKSDKFTIQDEDDRVLVSVIEHKEESTEAQLERSETEITTEKVAEDGAADAATPDAAAKDAKEPEAKK